MRETFRDFNKWNGWVDSILWVVRYNEMIRTFIQLGLNNWNEFLSKLRLVLLGK